MVGDRLPASHQLIRDIPAFEVSSNVPIISVECDDGDQGLPSDPVGHRSPEHVQPPSPAGRPEQHKVRVLDLGNPHDFINRSAHSHHRVEAALISWWDQGVELPACFLTDITAKKLLIERMKRRSEVISVWFDQVAEEVRAPADGITADRCSLDHMQEENNPSHRLGEFNARPDRHQRWFGKIRGH
jgi:hypothetical protein